MKYKFALNDNDMCPDTAYVSRLISCFECLSNNKCIFDKII